MKRRDFLKTTAAAAGAVTLGAPFVARAQSLPEVINVGHLVGICMSPLFFAHAAGYFKDEGLNVQLKFMPNPGDAITALVSNAMDVIHNPFTNAFVAAAQASAPIRIIAGSGAGGLFIIAQKESGIRSMADLAAAKGKGLKVGTIRFNTFELTLYRNLVRNNLAYGDFNIVWFNDTLSMASAFEAKALDVVTHVEPFATRLVDQLGGVPLASSLDVWGPHGPDCVTNTSVRFLERHPEALRRYIKALLRADAAIKGRHAEGGRGARCRQVLPGRQGHADRGAAAAIAAGRHHQGRRQGHGDRHQRHGDARLRQDRAQDRRHHLAQAGARLM